MASPRLDLLLKPSQPLRSGRAGVTMGYDVSATPFGPALSVIWDGRLAGLGFLDEGGEEPGLADMARRWPRARFERRTGAATLLGANLFNPDSWAGAAPLPLVLFGSAFEHLVWTALTGIAPGATQTYAGLARQLGKAGAARAIGAAVGRNPISFLIPCHRVVGSSGALTGYHWGIERKRAMLDWERRQFPSRS